MGSRRIAQQRQVAEVVAVEVVAVVVVALAAVALEAGCEVELGMAKAVARVRAVVARSRVGASGAVEAAAWVAAVGLG